jgi:hypothetical protein
MRFLCHLFVSNHYRGRATLILLRVEEGWLLDVMAQTRPYKAMKAKLLIASAAGWIFITFSLVAAEEKPLFESLKVSDTVVHNVRVTENTPTHVTIMFDGGGSRLKRQDLPPELKKLYPYDAKEAAAYERDQAADQARRAAAERARQERFNAELKASLQRQQPVISAKVDQLQADLKRLEREMDPLKARARGKPNSPARRELDAYRDRKVDLVRRLEEQKALLDKINKQLDRM